MDDTSEKYCFPPTGSIDEHYNEDEPQPKLTGYVRLEENSYFER